MEQLRLLHYCVLGGLAVEKTILVLPDGTELSSGKTGTDAIMRFDLLECVNEDQELTLGSVCASMAEITILNGGGFSVSEGRELTVFRENAEGTRRKVGIFIAQKPTRPTPHTVKLTAYDRVIRLDRDLTGWLNTLSDWPYTLQEFGTMVCNACGLTLTHTQLPNGNHTVNRFTAEGVTGRHLMRWVGELCGRFCRANADGDLEFSWYDDTNVTLSPSGEMFYFQKGFSYEDYAVAPIQRVQLRQSDTDVGTVYPDEPGGENTYVITGNPLATANTSGALVGIAQTLYEQLQEVSYTPCKLKISSDSQIRAGDVIRVLDPQGRQFTVYVMSCKLSGGRKTLECTGSPSRGSTENQNRLSYKALSGKVLNLQTTVEGLRAENRDTVGKMASLALDVEGISSEVSRQQTELTGVKTQMTAVEQTAQAMQIRIKSLTEEGTQKVKTETGFTLDEKGLTISRAGTRMENLLNETGMYVKRSGNVILKADQEGVTAVDVTVHNYLIVGDHARFENFSSSADTRRTACFWI